MGRFANFQPLPFNFDLGQALEAVRLKQQARRAAEQRELQKAYVENERRRQEAQVVTTATGRGFQVVDVPEGELTEDMAKGAFPVKPDSPWVAEAARALGYSNHDILEGSIPMFGFRGKAFILGSQAYRERKLEEEKTEADIASTRALTSARENADEMTAIEAAKDNVVRGLWNIAAQYRSFLQGGKKTTLDAGRFKVTDETGRTGTLEDYANLATRAEILLSKLAGLPGMDLKQAMQLAPEDILYEIVKKGRPSQITTMDPTPNQTDVAEARKVIMDALNLLEE